jgi:glycine/sarcosine N-methyltransferase
MYDQFASDYDKFNNWHERLEGELPFIEIILRTLPQPAKVLDSACGTGMHAIALSKRGYELSGADLSKPMIERARANARAENSPVRFEAVGFGSMAATFGEHSFDAVLCLGNSLPHLTSRDELRKALADFARCLRPGGILLIQNRNFDAVMEAKNRWMEPQAFSDKDHEWLFMRFYDFEPDGQIRFNMIDLKRPHGGAWHSTTASTMLMPQLHDELHQTLAGAGFLNIQDYGSMTGSVFVPTKSPNLVLVASA